VYRLVQVTSGGVRTTIDDMVERVRQAVAAGFAGVILETNYNPEITTAGEWLAALAGLQPVLDAESAS